MGMSDIESERIAYGMKTSFKKTGKPWIDLGIVALWDYFATRFEDDLTVEETF